MTLKDEGSLIKNLLNPLDFQKTKLKFIISIIAFREGFLSVRRLSWNQAINCIVNSLRSINKIGLAADCPVERGCRQLHAQVSSGVDYISIHRSFCLYYRVLFLRVTPLRSILCKTNAILSWRDKIRIQFNPLPYDNDSRSWHGLKIKYDEGYTCSTRSCIFYDYELPSVCCICLTRISFKLIFVCIYKFSGRHFSHFDMCYSY